MDEGFELCSDLFISGHCKTAAVTLLVLNLKHHVAEVKKSAGAAMKKILKTYVGILALGLTMFCSGGFYMHVWGQENAGANVDQYAWIVYWDQKDGLKELHQLRHSLNGVSVFALNFDEKGRFVYPEDWLKFNKKVADEKISPRYMTVVNDVFVSGGGSLPKDKQVLRLLLKNDMASLTHARNLVAEARNKGYDGLEIDYEGFWKDPDLVNKYQLFLKQLTETAGSAQLPLRIILEPSAPFGTLSWPQGPEYVVMLYNLYGSHSAEPGPKADKNFIAKTIVAMNALPGNSGVALATGGCAWSGGAKGKLISETQAADLQKYMKGLPLRDTASHAVHFSYAKKGQSGVCWYADGETIRYWSSIAKTLGIKKVFIWRLGHNQKVTGLFAGS